MPKVKKERNKLVHPNSRKALQMARASQKNSKKLDKIKDKASKLDATVKKLLWFQTNMDQNLAHYDKESLTQLVQKYLSRFEEEVEQIEIVRGVGCRNPTQYIARERAITVTQEHENMLLTTSGLEIPDLYDAKFKKEHRTTARLTSQDAPCIQQHKHTTKHEQTIKVIKKKTTTQKTKTQRKKKNKQTNWCEDAQTQQQKNTVKSREH